MFIRFDMIHKREKNRLFHVPQPTFLFPLETHLRLSRNMFHGWKDNSMLAKALAYVPICLQQFLSYTMLKSMRKSKNRYFYHIFVSPGDAHAKCCMDGKRIRCLQIVSQHVPIYLQKFPSYSNHKCKKSPFSRTAAHIFVSPGDDPATIPQYVVWMERQFNAWQTPRSMYLPIFNSSRVMRCLSQCVSPKIAIFTTFLFPLGQSR